MKAISRMNNVPLTFGNVRLFAVLIMCLLGLCSGPASAQCVVTKTFTFKTTASGSPSLTNPLAPNLTSLLKVVVMDDSVMWGDGLKPPEKFVALFGQSIADLTGRDVIVTSFAHSGARLHRIDDLNSTLPIIDGKPQGDLDSQRPNTEEHE